jgi:Leu/Phe-tRNA-protein transferase
MRVEEVGRMFFGEWMFARQSASRRAGAHHELLPKKLPMIDCQRTRRTLHVWGRVIRAIVAEALDRLVNWPNSRP